MKANLLALVASCLLMLFIGLVFADGSVPFEGFMEVQGSKIVSEGGYFRMEFTNPNYYTIKVNLRFPEEFNQEELEFELLGKEVRNVHLVAPWLQPLRWDPETGETVSGEYYRYFNIEIREEAWVGGSGPKNLEWRYPIVVVSLIAWKFGPEKLAMDELRKLSRENENLKKHLETRFQQIDDLKSSEFTKGFITGVLLIIVMVILGVAVYLITKFDRLVKKCWRRESHD